MAIAQFVNDYVERSLRARADGDTVLQNLNEQVLREYVAKKVITNWNMRTIWRAFWVRQWRQSAGIVQSVYRLHTSNHTQLSESEQYSLAIADS